MWMSDGPQVDRLLDDQVAPAGRPGRRDSSPPAIAATRLGLGEVDGRVGELVEHRVDRLGFGLAVVPVDRLVDLLLDGEDRLDVLVQDELELLDGVEVGRVGVMILSALPSRPAAGRRFRGRPIRAPVR